MWDMDNHLPQCSFAWYTFKKGKKTEAYCQTTGGYDIWKKSHVRYAAAM